MLTLSLLRHAKSAWGDPSIADHERPLSERGRRAVPVMAQCMNQHKLSPELVLCSTATRARETLALLLTALGEAPRVEFEKSLYLASPSAIRRRLARIKGDPAHVMVVGHNPGMHALALELARHGRKADIEALAAKFPTAGLAIITFACDAWSEVPLATGRLVLFVTPKRLGAAKS